MTTAIYIVVAIAALLLTFRFAFRKGAEHTVAAAQAAVDIMQTAVEDLQASQEEFCEANEEMTLLHSQNVGLVLTALDHHVAETGKTLDPDQSYIVEQIRPYYTAQTIH
jgi:hypothetical protein